MLSAFALRGMIPRTAAMSRRRPRNVDSATSIAESPADLERNIEYRPRVCRATFEGGAEQAGAVDQDEVAGRKASIVGGRALKDVEQRFFPGVSRDGGRAQAEYGAVVAGVVR